MSRDLTCNETMPALDDNENLTEVRRLVSSRNIGQQMPFATQFNFNSRGNNSASPMPANVSHTTTVRDIISSRMRNSKTNDSAITAFNNSTSTANQASTSSPSSTPYWIKTSSVSVNSNSADAVNSSPVFQTYITDTSKAIPGRTEIISQPAAGGGGGSKYATTTTFNHLQNSSMSATIPSHLLVTQFSSNQLASSSSPPSISFSSSSKLGQGVTTYRSSPSVNSSVSAVPIITNNYNNTTTQFSTVRSVTPASGGQPMPSTVTSYVIPSSVIGNGNSNIYASAALVQRNSDSPGKILVSRQQLTSASPSPAVLITPFVQQQQPPSRPSSSSYPATDFSMVRASNVSPSKAVPLPSSSAARASTYSVVLPTHSRSEQTVLQSVARESPNGLSNHGSTTPTNSQNPPHSHSSPRPSILRGNSAARRFAEKDLSQGVATNFSSLNFANNDSGGSGQSIVVNISANSNVGTTTVLSSDINDPQFKHISNIVTIPASNFVFSSSSGEDSLSRQDDSPRKRQRKQQFDNSQLQDKLMMEVRTDPRFDQMPPENAALWKVGTVTPSSSNQVPLKSGYSSGGEMATGGINLSGREPRRRGRPRSINKTPVDAYTNSTSNPTPPSSLGSMSYLVTTTLNNSAVGGGQNIQVVVPGSSNVSYLNSPAIAYGTAPPSSNVVQMSTGVGVVGSGANAPPNNATPRSFMVDVDSMLQMTSVKRPRKYKKRTPELNPETGEPIKKPRKKGSGRKSKKELLLLEAAKKGIPINYGGTVISGDGTLHHQGFAGTESLSSSASSGSRTLSTSAVSAHPNVYSSNASGGAVASAPAVAVSLSAPAGLITSSVGGQHHKMTHHPAQASQPQQNLLPSVSLFTRLSPEERNVVSMLCKFRSTKSHQAKENASAQQNKLTIESKKKEKIEELNEKLDDKESTPEESKAFQYDINVLLDVNKFSSLRHLWKSHDRNLSNNLADNYDDLVNFLAEQKMTNERRRGVRAFSKNAPLCSTFSSYEDFKNALNTLRLLPTACKYARNSKALLDSVRANVYGYSAYQLAQNRLAGDVENLDVSVDPNNFLPLSALKDSLDGVSENCNDLFFRLHKEVLRKLNAPEELDKLELERDLLVSLDVTETLYDVVDEADRISQEGFVEMDTKTTEWKDEGLCESPSENTNPLNQSIVSSNGISKFLAQLPEQYRCVVEKRRPDRQSRRVLPSHKRRRRHLESLSHSEKTTNDEERDCFEAELTDNRKVEFILHRLRETSGHSTKQYRNIRRWALKFLEMLEPELYAERVLSNRTLKDAVVGGCSSRNCSRYKRLRDHLEDSFLLDIVKGKSTFQPRDTYNPNKSIKMKPSAEQVGNLFKDTYFYGNGDDASSSGKRFCNECRKDKDSAAISSDPSTTNNTISTLSGQQQLLPKSIAAERLRETEANYLVMDEIEEMEENAAYTSLTSMTLLQKKYADKSDFSNIRGLVKAPTTSNDAATHSYMFDRSLKRRFPSGKTYLEQLEYFNDRCRETHEMAAASISLSHNRSNLLRQCYESLIELVKYHTKVSSHCDTNAGVVNGNDSDTEMSAKQNVNSNAAHNGKACRDEDVDDSSASSSDEFDQTSDEDDAAAPTSSHVRKSNTRSPSGGAPNISSSIGGIVKKRRWRNKKLAAIGRETSNGDGSGGRKTSVRRSNRPSPANFR